MASTLFRESRIIAPICIGVAILVGVLFLRPLYIEYIDRTTTLSTLEKSVEKVQADHASLVAIKNKYATGTTNDLSLRVKKLTKKYNTSDIMQIVMLNDFTKSSVEKNAPIKISSITVGKGTKLPSGLSLGNVSLTIQGGSVADIINYITYLTTETEYVFTIDNISLPIDTRPDEGDIPGGYGMTLELGVYYYE